MALTQIIIVGGSYAGLGSAKAILKKNKNCKVTVINPAREFYYNIASPRILANSKAFEQKQYLFPIENGFNGVPRGTFEFLQGEVEHVDKNSNSVVVKTSSGQERILDYDFLIIASGATAPAVRGDSGFVLPVKTTGSDSLPDDIANVQRLIREAQSIVIAGGGATGVELAGEIADNYPSKTVTLVSSGRLLAEMPESTSKAAIKGLEHLGAKIITGVKVVSHENGIVSLSNGKSLPAELYLPATGIIPNSTFLPQEFLDEKGFVVVENTLKVRGTKNVYAVGDVTNFKQKLGYRTRQQAGTLAKNIDAEINHTSATNTYSEGSLNALVVLSPKGGTGTLFGFTPWSSFVRLFKSKTYLIEKVSAQFGA